MKHFCDRATLFCAASLAAGLAMAPAMAESPCAGDSIRIISPHGSGISDLMARVVADGLSERLGQVVYVEPLTGAGGAIGIRALADAAPDGCTLGIVGLSTMIVAPLVEGREAMGYDPAADFTYVAMVGGSPAALAVNAELGISTLAGLADAMNRDGLTVTVATPGPTTITAILPRVILRRVAGDPVIVPYTQTGEAVVAAAEGHVNAVSITVSTMKAQVEAGALVPLFVSSSERLPAWPDVPTLAEMGHPDLDLSIWFGLGAPADMDPDMVSVLSEAVNAVLADAAAVAPLEKAGVTVSPMRPDEMAATVAEQTGRLSEAISGMDFQ